MSKKYSILYAIFFSAFFSINSFAQSFYCPNSSQIVSVALPGDLGWIYESTVTDHVWAQIGEYETTASIGGDFILENVQTYPNSADYIGTAACNYHAPDGTMVTLWLQTPAKPDNTDHQWAMFDNHTANCNDYSTDTAVCPMQ